MLSRLAELEVLTKGPAWALTRSAPWVIAALQTAFTRNRPHVELETFHDELDDFLAELRTRDAATHAPSTAGTLTGRLVADDWTRRRFLSRRAQGGRIVYELTEAAARVLAFLDSLSSDRSTLTGSRLGTLLADVEKLAQETNPDASARVEALEAEIGERREMIRGLESGELEAALEPDNAVEAAENILDLAAGLPADFKRMRDRIEESVGQLRNQIIEESLSKGATMAQVLEADRRLRESSEGRTFRSFTAFLENPEQQLRFRSAIAEVLSRDFADRLDAEERQTLRHLVAELRDQHSEIQGIYGKLSESLNTYVQSDDYRQSVRLRDAIRDAERAVRKLPYQREQAAFAPAPELFGADFDSLAMVKLFDPDEYVAPPRLAEPIAFGEGDRVRSARTGKANAGALRRAFDVALAAGGGRASAASVWHELPPEERHINTIRALLGELLHRGAVFAGSRGREGWEALDFEQVDGSERRAYVPLAEARAAEAAKNEAARNGAAKNADGTERGTA
ncbi:DUF3375 family protein [Sinomonas sp. JGH33]|uniref:DUF3375 family protein n=1 Tax=Sinomonas terricola TaxID=3110330 RepID=A0ABU5T7P0_9MICC|nr:DUF3375 family protein [Sinomonas sp. JGH33]MEA5455694.1 DUF3375 family protein [Sinomonas sp. JGH33]